MKKFFTLIVMAMTSLAMMAKDYTGHLNITVDNSVNKMIIEKDASISIDKGDNGYTLLLKNFSIEMMGASMGVGTIKLENVESSSIDGLTTLNYNETTTILDGDDDGTYTMSGVSVPINMVGRLTDDAFATTISINLSSNMKVDVDFTTTGYYIPNAGFEDFHTDYYNKGKSDEKSSEVPNSWRSFMSCTGIMSQGFFGTFTAGSIHTYKSNDVRPNSTGSSSVKIVSLNALITSANGTLTTGRLNAGSATSADKCNNSFIDMSKTDVDQNGDPFYVSMVGKPDSMKVWVKYTVGDRSDATKDNVYATASAIITDGTYYQDPEADGVTYTNVVAKAKNEQIASNNSEWQELNIPFTYTENKVDPKAILITLSTCAVPGGGSMSDDNPDILLVDDISLVYNAGVKSLSVKGSDINLIDDQKEYNTTATGNISVDDIKVVSDGQGAYITKQLETVDGGVKATITVVSNDLKKANTYTLNIAGATTGIKKTETVKNNTVSAIYNANGQRVSNMNQPGLYIIKNADGKTVKFLKK